MAEFANQLEQEQENYKLLENNMNMRIAIDQKKLDKANNVIEQTQIKFDVFLQHYNDRENPELQEDQKVSNEIINKIINEVKSYKVDDKKRRSIIYPGVDFDQRITPFSEDRPL